MPTLIARETNSSGAGLNAPAPPRPGDNHAGALLRVLAPVPRPTHDTQHAPGRLVQRNAVRAAATMFERLPPWSASPARPVGNPLSDREAEIDQDRSRLHQASLPVRPRRPAKCQVRHHRAHTVLRAPLRSRGRDRGRAVDGDAGRMARRTRAIRRGGLRRIRAQPSCPRDQRRHQSSRGPRRGGDLTSLPRTAVGATSASRKCREASSSPATPSAAPTRSTARA